VGALREKGIDIRPIAAGMTLNELFDAPDAALNLTLSSYMQPMAAKMEKMHGVPYASLHNAFTVESIDEMYGMISNTFNINWNGVFDAWRNKAAELEQRAKNELKGLKYVILPGVDMPVAVALYLSNFGMEPMLIHIEDFHPEDAGYAKQLKALGYDPPVCRMMNIDHDIEIVQNMNPDICFGHMPDHITGLNCAEEMGDFFGITGYERTAGILSRIFTVLETGKTGERMNYYGPAPV
jgi:nitrogenase molybdenum-iron protein alpha/beta subunit